MRLTIGSRGSQLALWQAHHIARRLREQGHELDVEIIHTTGDKITDVALAKVGTKGMFTKEIEEALAGGWIDLAVHSLKDLPTELSTQFEIAAVPARDDPRDAFCSKRYSSLDELPNGARIGTSSLRREAQLKALRSDMKVHPLRGNVDTRLRKLESGEYDGVILAIAGLRRLGGTEFVREIIPVDLMCPAAGQGALAVEIRAEDVPVREALAFLDDRVAHSETDCERAVLARLGGGCQVPIGANARWKIGELCLQAVVASPDGSLVFKESAVGSDPVSLGQSVGGKLLARGAAEILGQVYGQSVSIPQQP